MICRVVKVVLWSRGVHLTKPGWSKPHTHSNSTNLVIFRHKITLYRFNQGGSYYCRGLKWEHGSWAPYPSPHFNHWICPRRTLRPSSSPYTPYACGAQHALLPVAVGAMNIHDVRDRRRQTASLLNAPPRGWGMIKAWWSVVSCSKTELKRCTTVILR